MIDEQALRLPTYVEGTRIRLANGQSWSFPDPPPSREDDAHRRLLGAIGEAEDESERHVAELALTILLLSRNYRLASTDYAELLDYAPGDPALAELQAAVSALATRQRQALCPAAVANSAIPLPSTALWRFTHFFKRLSHAETS